MPAWDGMGMDARFQYSRGIALDAQGNIVPCAQAVAHIDCDAARAAVTPPRRGARPAALEATATLCATAQIGAAAPQRRTGSAPGPAPRCSCQGPTCHRARASVPPDLRCASRGPGPPVAPHLSRTTLKIDSANNVIRRITASDVVSTLATSLLRLQIHWHHTRRCTP